MPKVSVTSVLLALNVVIFGLMLAWGMDPMQPAIDGLIQWGANYGPKTTQGEWWRMFTCMFLHIGVLHLLFNMLALWNVGSCMERLLGSTGFLVLYLLAGLLGSVASVAWNPFVVSAGASGAIFGLYGGLLAFLMRHRAMQQHAFLAAEDQVRIGIGREERKQREAVGRSALGSARRQPMHDPRDGLVRGLRLGGPQERFGFAQSPHLREHVRMQPHGVGTMLAIAHSGGGIQTQAGVRQRILPAQLLDQDPGQAVACLDALGQVVEAEGPIAEARRRGAVVEDGYGQGLGSVGHAERR